MKRMTERDQRADIANRDDLLLLVTEFYTRAFRDELLGPIFVDVAKMDLEKHMPIMVDFWSTQLLGERSYRGGAFVPHAEVHEKVPLLKQHFERWVLIWFHTVDDHFSGEIAELAKAKAKRIAVAFDGRLKDPEPGPLMSYRTFD